MTFTGPQDKGLPNIRRPRRTRHDQAPERRRFDNFFDRYGGGAVGIKPAGATQVEPRAKSTAETGASTFICPLFTTRHLSLIGSTVAIRSKKKIVLLALLAGVVVLTGLLVRGYMKYRAFRENPAKILEAIPEGTNIVLGEVRHTAVREGRKEWVLEAASAQYSESTKEAVFDEVNVTFFLENGDQIHLQGQQGTINTASNDMQIAGSVRIEKGDQIFLTEKIDYNHESRHLTSPSEVRITGRRFDLRADSMQVDLGAETAFFEGSVEGKIDAANQLRL